MNLLCIQPPHEAITLHFACKCGHCFATLNKTGQNLTQNIDREKEKNINHAPFSENGPRESWYMKISRFCQQR